MEKEHKLERRNSQAAIGKLEVLRDQMNQGEGRVGKLEAEVEALRGKNTRLQEELVEARGREETDTEKIRGLERRIEELTEGREGEKEGLLGKLRDTAEELRAVGEEKNGLKEKLREKIEEFGVLEARSARERRNHTSNMEQALNSIVRLCVVAPTVNVQMSEDKSMAFKAPLPKEKIRHFVQDQVLPKFAKIFAQPKDGCAPDGKNSLDAWLQKVLVEMQHTIEKHLSKVFGRAA